MNQESAFWGVTVRGWIALFLVFTVCFMSVFKIDVKEPMYTLVVMAVSFYLGSRQTGKTDGNIAITTKGDINEQ